MNCFIIYSFRSVQVKRKTLCSWAPFSVVQPEILPGDLSRPGGPELLQSIKELSAQVISSPVCSAGDRYTLETSAAPGSGLRSFRSLLLR
jgi:hypothetical protein